MQITKHALYMFDQVRFLLFDRELQRSLCNNIVQNLTSSKDLRDSCDNQNSVWFLLRILIIMQLFCFHVIRRFQKKYESLIDTSRFISTLWMVVHSFPGRTFALTLSIMQTSCIPELTFTNIFYVSGPCQYNISAFKNLTQQTNGFRQSSN